ncbi:MAG: glycerol-3-phosphate 1-O-acyltransferase PlsY [Lentisphaerae bacterium]|nr:glycerol-3-phosphate 1-O-acyltransferase PlsY [Lentisphaerota bacterium]
MNAAWLALPAAYLLGAVPFGWLIGRARGVDVRRAGSGNIGATNVFRTVGKPWGILAFACDALKGYLAVRAVPALAAALTHTHPPAWLPVACACAAVAGHNWPVYLRFRGGKGVATSAGALLGLAPLLVAGGLLTWLVLFLATRFVSLASMLTAAAVAAASWFRYPDGPHLVPAAFTLLAVLTLWRHKANIRRLLNGTEHRFEFRKRKA